MENCRKLSFDYHQIPTLPISQNNVYQISGGGLCHCCRTSSEHSLQQWLWISYNKNSSKRRRKVLVEWARAWLNQQNDLCIQGSLSAYWADCNLCCVLYGWIRTQAFFRQIATINSRICWLFYFAILLLKPYKTLIRPGWSESLLGPQVILLVCVMVLVQFLAHLSGSLVSL